MKLLLFIALLTFSQHTPDASTQSETFWGVSKHTPDASTQSATFWGVSNPDLEYFFRYM